MLKVPASTLRDYCRKYADLLSPSAAATNKHRRYTDQDIVTLGRIKQLIRERKTPDEIRQLVNLVTDRPDETALASMPAVLEQFDQLRGQLASMQDQLAKTQDRLTKTEDQLASLEEYLKKPWYRRLISKPPGQS